MPSAVDFAFFAVAGLLGNVVRGLTGFGAAIILLCAWGLLVTATGLEVQGGVKRIIRVEAVLHATGALVLLATVPLRGRLWLPLLATLLPSIFIGVPLGARLLQVVAARPLELAAGCTLLVFCAQRVAPDVWCWWQGLRSGAPSAGGGKYVQLAATTGGAEEDGGEDWEAEEDDAPLGRPAAAGAPADGDAGPPRAAAPAGAQDADANADGDANAAHRSPAVQAVAGLLGGLSSGVLTGALSVGGPPTIIMYQQLACSKETVRAMSTLTTLVSAVVRVPSYILTSQLEWGDWPIYLTAALAGQVGLWLGIYLEPRVDARTFTRLLTGLLAACATILLVRAAGF